MKWSGEKQRKQREKLGYTLSELAKLLGISKSHLWGIEKGVQPSVGLAFEIANILKKLPIFFMEK